MKYILNYGKLNNRQDVLLLDYTSRNKLMFSVQEILLGNAITEKQIVYLLAIQDEIIVTENIALIIELFCNKLTSLDVSKDAQIYLFEEESYQGCYEMALDMREENPLCYDKQVDFTLN
jgi:hypothetical protein